MSSVVKTGITAADETLSGIAPTRTVGERMPARSVSLLEDYSQLFKSRVTTMVMVTAWAGFYLGAHKAGMPVMGLRMLCALTGIGLVSAGAAGWNEIFEIGVDRCMHRTQARPLPSGRMSRAHATVASLITTIGGVLLLTVTTNKLTGILALATSASYVFAYTPMKRLSPISTFIGAVPGAMPPLLGWTAARGYIEWEALALFAIVFFWQFPHFLAIAWLYREDYERAGVLMQPVVEPSGRGTLVQILLAAIALIPVSAVPVMLHMSGGVYLIGALILGLAYFAFGVRLARLRLPATAAHSKKYARQLLRASIIYLPLLFGLMIVNGAR